MTLSIEKNELVVAAGKPSHRHRRPYPDQSKDRLLAIGLACLAAVTRIWNLADYPRWFSDEGVYVSQAWAVLDLGKLAPYTYWYDHPPLGWIQLAASFALTGALKRHPESSILAGREFMVLMAVVAVVLLYILARRLRIRRPFAVLAGLLYTLSPLAVSFSRYVLLDNIAIAWLLAAMVLALSPTRKLSAAAGSGLCLGIAVLSKETAVLVAPAVVFLIWMHYRRTVNHGYAYILFGSVFGLFGILYPLFATLKGELLPGAGHVSFWQGQILFQLVSRSGSGSILDAHSDSRQLISNAWLGLDRWLPLAGTAALLPALFVRKLWAPAIALGLQVAKVFVGGYLPYPYIIALLPFMALLIAGLVDAYWPSLARLRRPGKPNLQTVFGVILVAAMALPFLHRGVPTWRTALASEFSTNETANQREALSWVGLHLPHSARLVTEGELWLDVRNLGFNSPAVLWTYKVDTDPAVRAEYGSVAGLDYLVLDQSTIDQSQATYLTIYRAIQNATSLASFGSGPNRIVVLQVTAQH